MCNAAIVGMPDLQRTGTVSAFVVLNDACVPGAAWLRELQEHARIRARGAPVPGLLYFVDALPRTVNDRHRQGSAPRCTSAQPRQRGFTPIPRKLKGTHRGDEKRVVRNLATTPKCYSKCRHVVFTLL
ncbi:AMP-binding enzyme [Paraburkholderia jirisanensis]